MTLRTEFALPSPAQLRYRSRALPSFMRILDDDPVSPEAIDELRATLGDFSISGQDCHLFTSYMHDLTGIGEDHIATSDDAVRGRSFIRVLSEIGQSDPEFLYKMIKAVPVEYAISSVFSGAERLFGEGFEIELRDQAYTMLSEIPFTPEQKRDIIEEHIFSPGKWVFLPEILLAGTWLNHMTEADRQEMLAAKTRSTIGYDNLLQSLRMFSGTRHVMSIGDHLAAAAPLIDMSKVPEWYQELVAAKGDRVGYPVEEPAPRGLNAV